MVLTFAKCHIWYILSVIRLLNADSRVSSVGSTRTSKYRVIVNIFLNEWRISLVARVLTHVHVVVRACCSTIYWTLNISYFLHSKSIRIFIRSRFWNQIYRRPFYYSVAVVDRSRIYWWKLRVRDFIECEHENWRKRIGLADIIETYVQRNTKTTTRRSLSLFLSLSSHVFIRIHSFIFVLVSCWLDNVRSYIILTRTVSLIRWHT